MGRATPNSSACTSVVCLRGIEAMAASGQEMEQHLGEGSRDWALSARGWYLKSWGGQEPVGG